MALKTAFEIDGIRFEPQGRCRYNGTIGQLWIIRRRRTDGLGWLHWGSRFVPNDRATRSDVVRAFDLEI